MGWSEIYCFKSNYIPIGFIARFTSKSEAGQVDQCTVSKPRLSLLLFWIWDVGFYLTFGFYHLTFIKLGYWEIV